MRPGRRRQPRESSRPGGPGGEGRERAVVMFVGTSLTAGLGARPAAGVPRADPGADRRRRPRLRGQNAGVSGETSRGRAAPDRWLLTQQPPAVLVLETGANDGLRGLDPGALRQNLEAILDRAAAQEPAPDVVDRSAWRPRQTWAHLHRAIPGSVPDRRGGARRRARALPARGGGGGGLAQSGRRHPPYTRRAAHHGRDGLAGAGAVASGAVRADRVATR